MKKSGWILTKAFRFCFPYILVDILLLLLTTAFSLMVAFVNRSIVNELTVNMEIGQVSVLFVSLIWVYMALYFLERASGFLVVLGNNFYRLNVDALFHRIFMWKSSRTPQERFYDSEFMEKYTFVSNNTSRISSYIGNLVNLFFSNIGALAGSMIIFAMYEPYLILYSLVICGLTFWLNGHISREEYQLDKKQIHEQRFHNYYKRMLTDKANAKELRVYHLQEFFYEKWLGVYEKLRMERLSLALRRLRLQNSHVLVKLVLRGAAVALLMAGVYYGRYDLGTFVMLFGLAETCAGQMDDLAQTIMRGSYKDTKYLNDYYDFVMPITNEEIKALRNKQAVSDVQLPYGEFRELKIEHAAFAYPQGNKNAVDEVSLSVRKGEIVSILGYNGSGKTTLSKLLSGSLFSGSGSITLNGIPMTEANQQEVFLYFGTAPQEFPHFTLELRDVVGLGRVEKMQERHELDLAYEKAGVDGLISRYEKGEEVVLGKEYDDEGVDLSGGEWQRLIIASAYMGQPEVLVMDEPTASIDPLKEMEMLHSLRNNLEGKTAILISHRIGFARLADRIVMMEDGKIVEEGSHDELIQANGSYAKLFNVQKALYQEERKS